MLDPVYRHRSLGYKEPPLRATLTQLQPIPPPHLYSAYTPFPPCPTLTLASFCLRFFTVIVTKGIRNLCFTPLSHNYNLHPSTFTVRILPRSQPVAGLNCVLRSPQFPRWVDRTEGPLLLRDLSIPRPTRRRRRRRRPRLPNLRILLPSHHRLKTVSPSPGDIYLTVALLWYSIGLLNVSRRQLPIGCGGIKL